LPALAVPRRRALEVALLLEEPTGRGPDPRAIGLALLDGVQMLAAAGPVVVAVDDLQWLDLASAGVLQFALRRLGDERVGFLATSRTGSGEEARVDVGRSFPEARLGRLSVGPLSLGALFHLLRDCLGLELARPQLVQLREVTGGNPFFALEVGRELAMARPAPGRQLPVPSTLRQLLGKRLGRLPADTREVLLSAAALARPTVAVLAAAHGPGVRVTDALEHAEHTGVIVLEDARVRFAHPLLASVCYEEALPWGRRAAHARLAAAVAECRARRPRIRSRSSSVMTARASSISGSGTVAAKHLEAVQGPAVHRQGARRRRAVFEPARARGRAVR
jgi:predicted ATPase